MMKKLLVLLAVLLLAVTSAMAEEAATPAIPVQVLPQGEDVLFMAEAVEKARGAMAVLPADCLIRAELARMSDDSQQWIVVIFDLTNFADGWCFAVDAHSGEIVGRDSTNIGYFNTVNDRWVSVKGPEALWTLEDKLLFDNLYSMQPTYGLPMESDIPQGEAMVKAMTAVGIANAADYQIGYGYIMGSGDAANGMWEVWFMQGGEMIYKVNLDAVTGEVMLIEPDEEGNG